MTAQRNHARARGSNIFRGENKHGGFKPFAYFNAVFLQGISGIFERLADLFGVSLDNLIRSNAENESGAYIAIDGGGTKTEYLLLDERFEAYDLRKYGDTEITFVRGANREETL